jgi:hypothetical protein
MSYSLLSLVDEPIKKRNYVFEMCISVNGRYIVIEDQVFDNVEQKNIGNIWESMDIFKTIFKNTNIENNEYNIIKENIIGLPILENKQDLFGLRDILLEFNFLEDTWVGRELKKSGKGITEFMGNSYEGLKKFNIAISKGDWTNIINLLSKGVKYILRSLKDAMYSNIGGVVDAVLIATGIGKTYQWIPWALITSLDIYQLINNDWVGEDATSPTWSKYLTIGFDILGLIGTGSMAISAKKTMAPLKALSNNPSKMVQFLKNNPTMINILEKMKSGVNAASSRIKSAYTFLKTKFPGGAEFIGKVINSIDNFFKKFVDSLDKLLTPNVTSKTVKGVKAGAKDLGISYGIETALNGLSNIQIANLNNALNLLKKIGLTSNTINENKRFSLYEGKLELNSLRDSLGKTVTDVEFNLIKKAKPNSFKIVLVNYFNDYIKKIENGEDVEILNDQIKDLLKKEVINNAIKSNMSSLSEDDLYKQMNNLLINIKNKHSNKTIKNTINTLMNGFNLKLVYRRNKAKSELNKVKIGKYKPNERDLGIIKNKITSNVLTKAEIAIVNKNIKELTWADNSEEWLKNSGDIIDNVLKNRLAEKGITQVKGVSTSESGWVFKVVNKLVGTKKRAAFAILIAIAISGNFYPGSAGKYTGDVVKWVIKNFFNAFLGNVTPETPETVNKTEPIFKKEQAQPSFDEFLRQNNIDSEYTVNEYGVYETSDGQYYDWDPNTQTYIKI